MSAGAPVQSVLAPAGEAAETIATMSWVLIIGGTLIFTGVMLLLAWAVWRRRPGAAGDDAPVHARRWIIGGGVLFPLVVLVALMVYSTWRTPGWLEKPPPGALIVSVTGHLWWWEVRYRDPASGAEVTLANELRLPAGQTAWIGLNSADVIHSFWVPALAGKIDMVPGRVNHLLVKPTQPGTWRGQCAEFCGEQHARMALHVVVEPPDAFDRWLAAQARPAAPPATALVTQGRDAFMAQRCNACHTVRGDSEEGRLGPDLTHVGSRLYLGAGTLRNDAANLAHWVHDTQGAKPGARMPSSPDMDPATLKAITAYLEHLQ